MKKLTYWDPGKTILKERFSLRNGKIVGLYESWWANGKKKCEAIHKKGIPHGLVSLWDEEGVKEEKWTINGLFYKTKEEYEESLFTSKSW